jgi:hypothetical protein
MRYSNAFDLAFKIWGLTLTFLFVTILPFSCIPNTAFGIILSAITTFIGLLPATILIKKITETKLDKSKKIALLLLLALIISNLLGLLGLHHFKMFEFLWIFLLSSIGLILSILYTMKNNWETNKNEEHEL